MTTFTTLLDRLPSALRPALEQRWQRYLDNVARDGLTPIADNAVLAQLVTVWAGSEFVAEACIRHPDLLDDLIASGDLQGSYPGTDYRRYGERVAAVLTADALDEPELMRRLRRLRLREAVRIAWRDLSGTASLDETLADLSDLAEAILDLTLERLYQWACERYGVPLGGAGQTQQRLVVLGMGKLGGHELNFSSDIDLILAYPERGATDKGTETETFFRQLAQRLVKVLQTVTADGYVYRVDLRLRPFGASGPVVIPFSACEDYYQSHGREWERYALIKARVVAGDRQAGARLLDTLQPFVYRRYLDYDAFESLRQLKTMINKEVQRKNRHRNIKLGPGGIREIEFIGQAFQLIYGGRDARLRQRTLLPVLDTLADSGRLPTAAVTELKTAYDFLRRAENRLQAWADQQTHDLPADSDSLAQLRLAYSMGFDDWPAFAAALAEHGARVKAQFALVFATDTAAKPADSAATAGTAAFAELWQALKQQADNSSDNIDPGNLAYLRRLGFGKPAAPGESDDKALARAWHALRRLRASFSVRALSTSGNERLGRLLPLLLEQLSGTETPAQTLERVCQLLEAIVRRSTYVALLLESATVRSQLIALCAASPWIAEYLCQHPLLLDDLLDPRTLYQPLTKAALEHNLARELEQVDDPERQLDALRHFKQSSVLRVAAADISGALPLMVVSDHLTEIAEVLLRRTFALAWQELTARFGRPCYRPGDDAERREAGFAIIAYGKLGGIELSYGSDLDIVFLHDSSGREQTTSGPKELDNTAFFTRLAQRIVHILSVHTAAGTLYEVDTRLRPSGRAGLLVSSVNAYAEYQRNQAWTWEHQALVRTRFITGSEAIQSRFGALRQEILGRPREPHALRQEVREMRNKMRQALGTKSTAEDRFDIKQDRGGMADIEFIVQYLVLAHAHDHPAVAVYSDNMRQLDALRDVGILDPDSVTLLQDAYRALRARAHKFTLQDRSAQVALSELPPEVLALRDGVIRLWQHILENP